MLLLGNSSNSLSPVQIKGSGDLRGNRCRIFATGFYPQRCFQVTRPAGIVEPLEALGIYEQGTIDLLAASLLLAAPPQFGNGRVQKDRGNSDASNSPSVFFLHECTASKGDDHRRSSLYLFQQLAQSRSLGTPKFLLSRGPEEFRDRPSLAPFDTLVQIHKRPPQPFSQGPPNAALARAHEADQKKSSHGQAARVRTILLWAVYT
jgi:hypothetical protein